jgi:hypothetical protein
MAFFKIIREWEGRGLREKGRTQNGKLAVNGRISNCFFNPCDPRESVADF